MYFIFPTLKEFESVISERKPSLVNRVCLLLLEIINSITYIFIDERDVKIAFPKWREK